MHATVSSLHSSSGYQQHQDCVQRCEGHHTEEKSGLVVVTVNQQIYNIVYINQYYHLYVNQIKYNDNEPVHSTLSFTIHMHNQYYIKKSSH